MRNCALPLFALSVVGCSTDDPTVDRLEIRAPGLKVVIDRQGNGSFKQSSSDKSGRFVLSPEKLAVLRNRTEQFRRSRDTIPASKMLDYARHGGRCEGPYVTDNGGISFHWTGPSLDQFFVVDYGCDPERYKTRNDHLQSILKSLPVPEPDSLP